MRRTLLAPGDSVILSGLLKDPYAKEEMNDTAYDTSRPPMNGWGLAGIITSLTCCLAPLGLLFSLIGMLRRPRLLPIIGLCISIPLTILMGTIVVKKEKAGYMFGQETGENIEVGGKIWWIMTSVAIVKEQTGEFPESLDELDIDDRFRTDPWGNPFEIRRILVRPEKEHPALFCRGKDGIEGTADDIITDLSTNEAVMGGDAELLPADHEPSAEEEKEEDNAEDKTDNGEKK